MTEVVFSMSPHQMTYHVGERRECEHRERGLWLETWDDRIVITKSTIIVWEWNKLNYQWEGKHK